MLTMTTNDNTNTNTSNHEWQMAGLEIHGPWHDRHITMSLLNMSSPLPSPSPHTLASWAKNCLWFPNQFLPHHKQHQQRPSTVRSPCLTIYPLHPVLHPDLILMVSFLTFFSSFFYILIVLSVRSTATTLPHHHYWYLQPTPNKIGSKRVYVLSLRLFIYLFIYIVLMFIYCHHQTRHNGHHILMVATSPPHQPSQWRKGLNLLLETYLKPLVGFFFFFFFTILTFIYLWLGHTASPRHVWPWDHHVDTSNEYFTLPHSFQADPSRFQVESEQNGRNGRNLVGMKC